VSYRNQPYRPHPARRSNDLLECPLLVYLDVWERHITYIEDPEIREPALGGADTATRSQVIWQVKLWPLPERWVEGAQAWPVFQAWRRIGPDFRIGCMRADVARPSGSGAGTVAPASPRFLGPENHLYRVEVHRVHPDRQELAFKWSRDNGSVAYPVSAVEGALVTLAPWASEDAIRLQAGDWVEIEDDRYALLGPEQVVVTEETLFRVAHVEPSTRQVRLQKAPPAAFGQNLDEHPLLRRWDQKGNEEQALVGGAVKVSLTEEGWHDLEYGVRIQFQATGEYQRGYYWQIPARYDSGTLLWPRTLDPESGEPVSQFRPPPGVHHHYAPLAIVTHDGEVVDCRRVFQPLAEAVLRQK
jgi:hypothetical protein